MNLKELKNDVDFIVEHLQDHMDSENVQVLITLSENSIGARASSEVKYVGMGFDWEHGQCRIEPSKALVGEGDSLTNIKKVIRYEFGGQKYYACPRCIRKIAKDDFYCRHCGQKLK